MSGKQYLINIKQKVRVLNKISEQIQFFNMEYIIYCFQLNQ
jgi:hypothetical protein